MQIIFSLHYAGFSIVKTCILLSNGYIIYIALYIATSLLHKAETFFSELGQTGHDRSKYDKPLADARRL